jgi:hypothetical protein
MSLFAQITQSPSGPATGTAAPAWANAPRAPWTYDEPLGG